VKVEVKDEAQDKEGPRLYSQIMIS